MRSFGSDNHSAVHPKIWVALDSARSDHAPSYGTDPLSAEALSLFRTHFGDPLDVFFVFNGTGANVLALSGLLQSYESVLCAQTAHLNLDECAAPEAVGRFKLIPVPTLNGKITPEDVVRHIVRRGDQHSAQIRAISITQPTEYGTLYTLDEMRALGQVAKAHQLYFHVDGARFILAAERLNCSFRELTRDVGVDVLSFGGTKNGLMMGEAVLVFRKDLRERYKYLRKQFMQLPSKTRFIGAQFRALLSGNLWQEIANHSCEMAQDFARRLQQFPQLIVTQPVQTNAVFVKIPKSYVSQLRESYFFYVWDEQTFEARLMTSFDTRPDDIEGFIRTLENIIALED